MDKISGIDLGTNSIGLSVRDADNGNNLQAQLDFFTSVVFKSGVGNGKSGEFSYAAKRTEKRSSRRLYQARKYRIWNTLSVLIDHGFCPLSIEDLDKWRKYDRANGQKRQYPIDATAFEQWVCLDFDGDGIADYTSPYQLRAELMQKQFDFSKETDRFKLGRALYHIAQRRGFKSSKGETIKEQEQAGTEDNTENEIDLSAELKKSEEKKSSKLVSYMKEHNLPTVGCAFAHLEDAGIRVRNSDYQAVRSQYKEEIKAIFEFQNELDVDCDFYKRIASEKKKEGTIFYKRPLRSQKGLVGKCTLEPNKSRCPVSHPEFEKFRAWCFINNIKFGEGLKTSLSVKQKQRLFNGKFLLTRSNFKFEDIRKWIEKEIGQQLNYKLKTINYKDNTNVSGCPISGRLKNLLGENWEQWTLQSDKERVNRKSGEIHKITYTAEDIWHICFSFDEAENIEEFAKTELYFDADKTKQLVRIWSAIAQGYSMLSLKAIKSINRFLQKGLIYTDAVLLAKLPELFKDKWAENEDTIISEIDNIIAVNRKEKQLMNIANALIASYKSLDETQQFAFKNYEYTLDADDSNDIKKTTIETVGEKTWAKQSEAEQNEILASVETRYQQFFASPERDYFHLPKLADALAIYLHKKYSFLNESDLRKIYHPSMIDFYAPAKEQQIKDGRWLKLLGSPVIGALKNPMAMRVLHTLRWQINPLLIDGTIDEDTRMVVETARELNDANMRLAIETYQREREAENKEFEKAIKEHFPQRDISDEDIDKVRLLADQYDVSDGTETPVESEKETKKKKKVERVDTYKKDVTKYRLWLEQGCRCIYTGKLINITTLFDDNQVDFEHTIPRSISFDNSLSNLTVCDAHFNRTIKKNQIPTQLPNYDEILQRIQPWISKVETLKDNVEFWKGQSKRAQEKARKDYCIRQRHLWEMELDYWQKKVNSFTMTEVTSGFRNSQLNDTRIITKYAYHYLKTVFNKVEVQNGRYTADFRKMLGVQSVDEKKSRDKHSHHAIDATMLTLIPVAARRDKMLELFYKKTEERNLHGESEKYIELDNKLREEIRKCGFGNASDIGDFIEQNILVNHISKDQTLTPAKRKARVRGKEVFVKNKDGNLVNKWLQGDCIRGQLHKDSFFGAVKYPQTDDKGFPIKKDGKFVYEKDKKGNTVISMVMRVPITSFKDEKDVGKIIDPMVKNAILETIHKRTADGKSFAAALAEPFWLLDESGNEIKFDKNGRQLSPIRHVRCKVAAGRGYFTKEKALVIKEQTYKSEKEYKNFYYAQNDGNYLCLLYECANKGKLERKFRLINYFETVKLGIKSAEELWNEPYFKQMKDGKKEYKLSGIIKAGTRVLMWQQTPDELRGLSASQLSKRLFVVYKYNSKGSDFIYLQNHIEAKPDAEIKEDDTIFNIEKYQARLHLVASNLNCLIEGRDFDISANGKIKFYDE